MTAASRVFRHLIPFTILSDGVEYGDALHVRTVAGMRALPNPPADAVLLGSPLDSISGVYYWDGANVDPDDGQDRIAVTLVGAVGRYVRISGSAVTGGVVWRAGAGAPSAALGANGDFYIDTTTVPGDVYLKTAGAYALSLNIRGPTGATGATGAAGSPAAATPLATVAPVNVTKATAVIGVSAEAAHADHKHDVTTGTPVDVGNNNDAGTGNALALANHVHKLPFSTAAFALGQATSAVGVNSQLISFVANPVSAQDAATKSYVDATLPNANVYSASGTWADAAFHTILTIDLSTFGDNRSFHCDTFALYFETAGTLYAGSVSMIIGLQRRAGTVTVKGTLQVPTTGSSVAAAGVAGTADVGTPPKIQGIISGSNLLVQVQNALGVNTNWYAVAKVTHQ